MVAQNLVDRVMTEYARTAEHQRRRFEREQEPVDRSVSRARAERRRFVSETAAFASGVAVDLEEGDLADLQEDLTRRAERLMFDGVDEMDHVMEAYELTTGIGILLLYSGVSL